MATETVRMSSKGQIVIPQDIREELEAGEGTVFAVAGTSDTIILKKIETPSTEKMLAALERISKIGKETLIKKGIKREEDIVRIIHERRAKNRT